MKENKDNKQMIDWDMMEDYYSNEGQGKVRSLEEIAKESESELIGEADINAFSEKDARLLQTIEDVKRVKEASVGGATIDEIAKRLDMDRDYVALILMTREGYAEDSDIAVAHLVLMG